jgi:hypothetical protein
MGIVCYVLAGLLLAAALVVPVIGAIAALIVSVWGAAASGMALRKGHHDPIGVAFEAVVNVVISILDFLGPIPTILVALLTIVVEIGLLAGAAILIVIGRMLRRPARAGGTPSR